MLLWRQTQSIHSGIPQAFIDWTWRTWLPSNRHRYEKQIGEHIAHIDLKFDNLDKDIEHIAGGDIDYRDEAADLRDRLKRELSSTALQS